MSRWHSCNVLHVRPDARQVWQFDARNGKFPLNREQTAPTGEPLPRKMVGKSWSSLWQPKLNVAWLPPENVFVRVAHLPPSTPEELHSMVDLQLEKLSPIPVTQAVWSMHTLPNSGAKPSAGDSPAPAMQTIVLIIAARNAVEEFLGKLEGDGYLADRLELPLLDQLLATQATGDGAWIYPDTQAAGTFALVAWWYGGVLQTVDFLVAPGGADRAASVRDQLMQMAWAGELEGWLTSPPHLHLVADESTAAQWAPALEQGFEQPIEVTPPLPPAELAARTARRATQTEVKDNLLPAEFATRYQQRFVDKLWMRGLMVAMGIYVVGLLVYFVAVSFLTHQTTTLEARVRENSMPYTNALHLKAELDVLNKRKELRNAALDCWEAVAELLPENITLGSMNFRDGNQLDLSGTAPATENIAANEFSGKLRKATARGGEQLFWLDPSHGKPYESRILPPNNMSWSFGLELKQGGEQ